MSEGTVCSVLRNLDNNKAHGPDEIPARLLTETAYQIAPSLCLLFNKSLKSGIVPREWKIANVVPIHKKGDKDHVENYRPISLLSLVSKVLERCVFISIKEHAFSQINSCQHGFISGKSCVTQLIEVLDTVAIRRTLYLSLVLSHLGYATQLWAPQTVELVKRVERVQRRATKYILNVPFICDTEYRDRLLATSLLPLSYWHEYLDVVFLYKANHDIFNIDKTFFHFLNLRVKDRQDHLIRIPTRTNIKFRHIRRQPMKNLTKSEHQEYGTHYLIILHPKTEHFQNSRIFF